MTPQKSFNHDHTARYLVLLDHEEATRALLFGQDQRYLAEVIDDDGLVIENLMRAGKECAPPPTVAAHAEGDKPMRLLCFKLEARGCNA